jgi:alkanesulfonate monooxygenase SsuD/methylene tetrahydromethanopterin reductase-like flavin-dependent oxidoreductase (luciferase family)
MTRFHISVPTRIPARAELPDFVTDIRPPVRGGGQHLVGRAAELAGLDGVLVPFDPYGLESLVVAAGLLRDSRRLRVIAEFHPGVATPVYAAKLSASLQRYTGGRLGWQLAVDLDPAVARAQGDFLTGDARYTRAAEFLTIARGVWSGGDDYTFDGTYFQVRNGGLPESRTPRPFPPVYLSGTSARALELSAVHADVHVLDAGEDPGLVPDGVVPAVRLPVRLPVAGDVEAESELAEVITGYVDLGIAEFFLVVEPGTAADDVYRLGQRVLPLVLPATEVRHG